MRIGNERFGFELGIVLLILSIPISQIIKLVFGLIYIDISTILLIISLLLICNKSNLLRFKFPSMSRWYILILGFQLYNVLIAILANVGLFTANYGIIYILFTIVLIMMISTNKRLINYELVIKLSIYISGIFNLLLLYYLTDGFISLVPNNIGMISEGGILVADRLTLSNIAYFYIIAFLVFNSKNYIEKVCSYAFLLFSLLNILATSRRGLMVALIIILLVHFINKIRQNKLSKNTLLGILKFSGFCLVSLIIVILLKNSIPELWEQVEAFTNRFTSSLSTFFEGGAETSQKDAAAYSRVLARQNSYILLNEASLIELFFGFGYMHEWIDFPFLQAIVDMGLLLGTIYIYIQVKPIISTLMKKNGLPDRAVFFLYLALVGLFNNIFSGIPYGYYKYVYLIPFLYVLVSEIKKKAANSQWD